MKFVITEIKERKKIVKDGVAVADFEGKHSVGDFAFDLFSDFRIWNFHFLI